MRLRSAAGDKEKALINYANQVVRALGIAQGPTHMEIILTPTGPCLVEVGTRCHGGEVLSIYLFINLSIILLINLLIIQFINLFIL